MKKVFLWSVIIIIVAGAVLALAWRSKGRTLSFKSQPAETGNSNIASAPMTITSPAFLNGQAIPKKYTCDGDGVNPPLSFGDVPQGAQSLALVIEDPDAPSGTWYHWVLWNIPPDAATIAENSVPAGAVVGQASSGQNDYGGPCPPSGMHHYNFYLYALDTKLELSSFSDAAALHKAMDPNVIASAELAGTYAR